MRRATLLSIALPVVAATAIAGLVFAPTGASTPIPPVADGERRTPAGVTYSFAEGVDAISFAMPQDLRGAAVRAWLGDRWTPWEDLAVETEFDPLLTESNLVLFPHATQTIELRSTERLEPHPIRVSQAPAAYQVAARGTTARPRILTRSDWGADDSFLVEGAPENRSDSTDDVQAAETREANGTSGQPTSRVTDCLQLQRDYPEEFKVAKTVRANAEGQKLRWPQQYSKQIRVIAVHHTAITVTGDSRSGVEKIRALYAYHANNRGWGDVGYHYLIDDDGQIYEGRAGGPGVVGGHAYCNNIGSVGVALLGNFELEQPTQAQMAALQWLLHNLAATYAIDLNTPVTFHGKSIPPIVGHGDLVSTTCPGYYVRQTLDQIRRNVRTGNITARISFPSLPKSLNPRTLQRASSRVARVRSFASLAPQTEGVAPMGDTTISGRPNAQLIVSLRYQAGGTAHRAGEQVARVERSDEGIRVWQEKDGVFTPVLRFLKLPTPVASRNAIQLRLKVQLPESVGRYTLQFDDVTYVIDVQGRALRASASATSDPRMRPLRAPSSSSRSSIRSVGRMAPSSRAQPVGDGPAIRIRLSYDGGATATLTVPSGTTVNGAAVRSGGVELRQEGNFCVARQNGVELARGTVRFDSHATGNGGTIAIASWKKELNHFRGVIECQVVDGELALINELPIEQYLRGLSEEPDSEPFEKQRAFAIAARTYAAFYMDPKNRKFPGKPYDGSDDPRVFQAYGGAGFETRNSEWTRAVDATHLQVLTKDGDLLKTPYFSVSDGRTRSPEEIGWKNFPHAEVFQSKADPWCQGMTMRGHGVGMSGCGALGQAKAGKSAEAILAYYYKGAVLTPFTTHP